MRFILKYDGFVKKIEVFASEKWISFGTINFWLDLVIFGSKRKEKKGADFGGEVLPFF